MNSTELRLGNLVALLQTNKGISIPTATTFKVITIHPFEVELVHSNVNPAQVKEWMKFPMEKISPIPINEERLKLLGGNPEFCTTGFDFSYGDSNGYNVEQRENGLWYFDDDFYGISKQINYVHELQNLFFAITGEELKPV